MSLCRKFLVKRMGSDAPEDFRDLSQDAENLPYALLDSLQDALRAWERQFGLIDYASHRDRAAKQARREQNLTHERSQRSGKLHKRFKDSQRYDGVDPNVNPNPQVNEHAEEAARNENAYRYTPGQRPGMTPRKPQPN